MQIIKDYPPNYQQILTAFPSIKNKIGILYCWGSTIYTLGSKEIPEWLLAHEETHCKQQGNNIDEWWSKYLMIDASFRLSQELEAHIVEVKVFSKTHKDRNEQLRYLWTAAKRLSSPMYGNCISFSEAVKRIKSA